MNIRNMIIQDFEECGLYDANHLYCVGKALFPNIHLFDP
jgi:hypothetical protein